MTETAAPSVDPAAPPVTPAVSAQPFSASYTRYAMFLLLGIYIVNFLDRAVVNILAEPIKNVNHNHRKQYCKYGHDTLAYGRTKWGHCRECSRGSRQAKEAA